ncbi:MAG: hypothetical protein QXU82_03480 [Candidatus Aenigmatarchaeota archaeon]
MKMREFEEKIRTYFSDDLRRLKGDFGKSELWGAYVEKLEWGEYPAYMFHCDDGKVLVYDARNASSLDFYAKIRDAVLGTESSVHLMDIDNIAEVAPSPAKAHS